MMALFGYALYIFVTAIKEPYTHDLKTFTVRHENPQYQVDPQNEPDFGAGIGLAY